MFCLAVEYILLDAQFIGVIQVLVYAGAIMVVFLFVIMLLNLGHPSEIADIRGTGAKLLAAFVGIVMLTEIGFLWRVGLPSIKYAVPAGYADSQFAKYGVVGAVAKPLYQDYSLAFELTSVLLLVAIAGAVVIGRRKEIAVDGAKVVANPSSNGAA
jgi:NADH-quinone oxidoreductase subunit J